MDKEKRRHPRVSTLNLMSYVCLDENENQFDQGMGRTLDISQGGLLMETPAPIESKYILLMAIDFKDELVNIKGQVAHSRKTKEKKFNTGIRFVEPNEKINEIIVGLIKAFNLQKAGHDLKKSTSLA